MYSKKEMILFSHVARIHRFSSKSWYSVANMRDLHLSQIQRSLVRLPVTSKRYLVDNPQKTITQIKHKINEMMGVGKGYTVVPPNREPLLKYLPKTQVELPVRSMMDSFDSALIPLGSDKVLQDSYMTLLGHVRKGRLLEDMDIFAVWICSRHIYDSKIAKENIHYPFTLVTAAVDRITFMGWNCKVTDDMRISGHVQWTGRSSMEVCVWLESSVMGEWKLYTTAYFTMVARNATNSGPAFVNVLKAKGPDEEIKYENAKKRVQRRRSLQEISLLKRPPSTEEQKTIHNIFMKTVDLTDPTLNRRILSSNSVWMESTKQSNMIFPHPDDRNAHNTVFGGLLMRLSSELSWITAFTFSKRRPTLRHINDITFKSPVSINSFIRMTGQVVYTELNYAQVGIQCESMDVLTSKMITTNTFSYTYVSDQVLPEVVPQTYLEAMLWLDGRRHFRESMQQQ